jgi:hypothetical protein
MCNKNYGKACTDVELKKGDEILYATYLED